MSNTSALLKLLNSLKTECENHKDVIYNYAIPELWNIHNYSDSNIIHVPNGDVLVNPYTFLIDLIEDEILSKKKARVNYSKSLSTIKKEKNNGDWIKTAVAYSILPRASAAYDHDRTGTQRGQVPQGYPPRPFPFDCRSLGRDPHDSAGRAACKRGIM